MKTPGISKIPFLFPENRGKIGSPVFPVVNFYQKNHPVIRIVQPLFIVPSYIEHPNIDMIR